MTFRVPKNLREGDVATITNINMNFAAIEQEINAIGTDGILAPNFVTTDLIKDGTIPASRLGNIIRTTLTTGESDTTLASTEAIEEYLKTAIWSNL
jgi:hypothetical protein